MTEIDVPDWLVEQAFNAWCDVADVDEWRVRNSHEALRAALTAALGAWMVPVGYVHEQTLSDLNDCLAKPSLRAGGTIWSCQGGPYTEPLYTLSQEKPE